MTSNQPKNIVVVGGSLAGLFTAIPLLRLGHNVTILERTPSFKLIDQGAGIAAIPVIPPIGAAFKELSKNPNPVSPIVDFFAEFDRTKTPFHSQVIENFKWLNKKGEVKKETIARDAIGVKDGVVNAGGCSWDLLYTILRANFDRGLAGSYVAPASKLETDGKAIYRDGVRVTDVVDCGEKVEVVYEGGSVLADFVVAADGPGSLVRQLLLPEAERKYVGYVAWRGMVKESELSRETRKFLGDHVVMFQAEGTQVLTYRIPGLRGTLEEGEQLMNIVWYENYADTKELLTDSEGVQHTHSLGVGKISPARQQTQLETAAKILPPQFYETWSRVQSPFIQAITDNISSRAVFMGGKVALVGDAVAGFRPHTTSGTAQGCMHALLLRSAFIRELTMEDWEGKVVGFAKFVSGIGVGMGTLSEFGKHPMADVDAKDDAGGHK